MRCSVIIPCHNGVDLTRRCVESLLRQHGIDQLEILLVDNASTDDTAELAQLSPTVRCLRQTSNLGFAGGVNAGLAAATHAIVVVLNNDTQAPTNLLGELHRALSSDPRIAAVAPVSNFVKGPAGLDIGPAGRDPAVCEQIAAELQAGAGGKLQDVDSLAGLCLMLRAATIAEIGPFDERFGNGNFEDDDFCLRLRLAGHRLVIARSAFLHHEGHATFRSLGLDIHGELGRRGDQFRAKWETDPAGRAILAGQRGDRAAAAAAAREARQRWPAWPDADWHLGQWHAARGEHAAAAACFEALLSACPMHSEAALELAICRLQQGDRAGARQHLAWAGEHCHLAPAVLAQALRRIGEHLYGTGAWAAANASFADALVLEPEDGRLHNWFGSCQLALGEIDTAAAAFEAAIARNQPLAHTNLAICEFRRGRHDRAAHHFATARELLPDDAVTRANYEAFQAAIASMPAHVPSS